MRLRTRTTLTNPKHRYAVAAIEKSRGDSTGSPRDAPERVQAESTSGTRTRYRLGFRERAN